MVDPKIALSVKDIEDHCRAIGDIQKSTMVLIEDQCRSIGDMLDDLKALTDELRQMNQDRKAHAEESSRDHQLIMQMLQEFRQDLLDQAND